MDTNGNFIEILFEPKKGMESAAATFKQLCAAKTFKERTGRDGTQEEIDSML